MSAKWLLVILLAAALPLLFSLLFVIYVKPEADQRETREHVQDSIIGIAPVSSIEVEVGRRQVLLVVRGEFNSTCGEIENYEIVPVEGGFDIHLQSRTLLSNACDSREIPYEQWISIDMSKRERGDYVVRVNDVVKGFVW